jgi:fructokinase
VTAPLYAGVEAGGTKFVCGVGRGPQDILRAHRIPTGAPDETLREVIAFFKTCEAEFGPIAGLGVVSFGPLDLDPRSPSYGALTTTPKPGWAGFGLRATLAEAMGCRVAIDTDVAGAGMAEAAFGAGRGRRSLVYVTVGTGIGGAHIIDGAPVYGWGHAEMGHIPVRKHAADHDFAGACPFHGDCLEGLASGPSVPARLGAPLQDLSADAPIWPVLADYIAQLCHAITLISAPERIVLGGGVMSGAGMFPRLHQAFLGQDRGYVARLSDLATVQNYLVPPDLGGEAGLAGALMLAQRAAVVDT